MYAVVYVALAWLTADLVTGFVHWLEDRYGNPAWPVIGKHVIAPNIRHHADPRAFLAGNFFERNWTAAAPALIFAAGFACVGWYWFALVAGFSSLANEVHAWSHQKCSRGIRGLQLLGVLCPQEDHARHHTRPFDCYYCVMTGYLNPVLSFIRFWPSLEMLLGYPTGIWPRKEREHA